MIKPFQPQIDKLNFIVEYWNEFKTNPEQTEQLFKNTFKTTCFDITTGLCSNIFTGDLLEDYRENRELCSNMFKSFPKFSGRFHFPLDDFEVYEELINFTQTPERLELAQHCIKFLTEEQNKRLGAIKKANTPKSKMVINLDDFNLSKDGYKRYCDNETNYEHKFNSSFELCVYQNDKGLQVIQKCEDFNYDVHLFQHEGKVTDTVLHGTLFNYLKG